MRAYDFPILKKIYRLSRGSNPKPWAGEADTLYFSATEPTSSVYKGFLVKDLTFKALIHVASSARQSATVSLLPPCIGYFSLAFHPIHREGEVS